MRETEAKFRVQRFEALRCCRFVEMEGEAIEPLVPALGLEDVYPEPH